MFVSIRKKIKIFWIFYIGLSSLLIAFLISSCASNPVFQATDTVISPTLASGITPSSDSNLTTTASPSAAPDHASIPTSTTEELIPPSPVPTKGLALPADTYSNQALYFFDNSFSIYGYSFPLDEPPYLSTHIVHSPNNDSSWGAVSFSHYSNQIVHYSTKNDPVWGSPEIWISDFSLSTNSKVLSDEKHIYSRVDWTPDDLHIIIHREQKEEESIIYHLETGIAEPWPYRCNQVAVSPKTGQFALWCLSTQENPALKVIEWGGEIWDSPQPPDRIVVETNSKIDYVPEQWEWSPDGKRIAYFDSEGSLRVASTEGTSMNILPGAIDWTAEEITMAYNRSIQWSANGERLLVFAEGSDEEPCPPDKETYADFAVPDPQPPCWQVYDAATGDVVWHLSDFMETDSQFISVASISPDGSMIALSYIHFGDRLLTIRDLSTGEEVWGHTLYADELRWAEAP